MCNAVTEFTQTLVSILSNERPQWMAVAFDTRNRQAIRYQIHPDYKAKRSPSPPELELQFQRCREVCEAVKVPALYDDDIEADDVIGQMANLARDDGKNLHNLLIKTMCIGILHKTPAALINS